MTGFDLLDLALAALSLSTALIAIGETDIRSLSLLDRLTFILWVGVLMFFGLLLPVMVLGRVT